MDMEALYDLHHAFSVVIRHIRRTSPGSDLVEELKPYAEELYVQLEDGWIQQELWQEDRPA